MQKLFCDTCKGDLIDGVCPKCTGASFNPMAQAQNDPSAKFRGFFMNPKEKLVCTLGNTYVQNFLSNGGLSKGFSVVSDKRVYFKGTTYFVEGKKLRRMKESKTVDLKDVTGTSVSTYTDTWRKVLGILFIAVFVLVFIFAIASSAYEEEAENIGEPPPEQAAYEPEPSPMMPPPTRTGQPSNSSSPASSSRVTPILVFVGILIAGLPILGIALLISYFTTRITLLKVEYAGGAIGFDIRWFSMEECEEYQKLLRIAKDKAIEEAESSTANAVTSAMSQFASAVVQPVGVSAPVAVSSADELMKYAQLFKDGLISKEEFDEYKAELKK